MISDERKAVEELSLRPSGFWYNCQRVNGPIGVLGSL
ncbi:hypothetical protein MGA3_15086 [Bacillus methanolicus MGA3]|nr:hypothetical protein MGA3_15086 [Bacillus methanolicus MGA3]